MTLFETLLSLLNRLQYGKKPTHLIKVRLFDELVNDNHLAMINSIYQNSHTSESDWQKSYLPTIKNLILFIQSLPASEYHHHCYKGGFVDHSLEVVDIALKKRNTLMLPRGDMIENQNKKKDRWTFAVFVAAIMHDIGKINSDVIINLYDQHYQLLGRWCPYSGNMPAINAKYYDYIYNADHRYKDHVLISATMLTHIIPVAAIDYLQQDRELFYLVLLSINGCYTEAGDIGNIIKSSDSNSVSKSLLNRTNTNNSQTQQPSLADKLLAAIRYVVIEKKQTKKTNAPGAIALTTKQFVYLFSKRVLDEAREEFDKHDQGGIPYDNSRLMDELIDFNIIDTNDKGKAIFDITVAQGGFKSKQSFTMLRMPIHRLYLDESKRPQPFTGILTEVSSIKPDGKPNKANEVNEQKPINPAEQVIATPVDEANEQKPINPAEQVIATPVDEVNEQKPINPTEQVIATPVNEVNLDLPPGFELKPLESDEDNAQNNNTQPKSQDEDNAQNNNTQPKSIKPDFAALTARECGQLFINWLADGLKHGKIMINNKNASVHVLKEGLFLVSPSIFKLYNQEHWSKIQKGLTQLKIAKKTPYDTNIWKVSVKPEYHHDKNKSTQISGYLIGNYTEKEKLKIPKLPINEKLSLKQ